MAELIELLSFLSSTLAAGLIASWLITQARLRWPVPSRAQFAAAASIRRTLWTALYAPRYARWLSLALAGLVSLLASLAVATLTGAATSPILDAALAAIIGQVRHSLQTTATITPSNRNGH